MSSMLILFFFAALGTSSARMLYESSSSNSSSTSAGSLTEFHGDGTAYSESVKDGSGFACSYRYLNEWNRKYFVAINSKQWDNGMSCGKCLTARCVDPMCTVNTPLTLFVADLCPECSHGDVDFSIPAYEELTGIWPHRLQIKWNWTDCPADKMSGTIRLDPKDGINAFWSAFYVSNSRLPLSRVTLDGKELERQQFNFWINSAPLGAAPHKLELEAQNGDKLTTTVDDMLKSQDLGIQF